MTIGPMKNPYAGAGRWYKGNLHTHTAPVSPCSELSPKTVLDSYAERGYDFLSISDHMALTSLSDPRICIIPGLEWNASIIDAGGFFRFHTGVYATDAALLSAALAREDHDEMLADLSSTRALTVLNHPDSRKPPHYTKSELAAKSGYDGIEIFNGGARRSTGKGHALEKWDFLLQSGRAVFGFAADDAHLPIDIGHGWIVVCAPAKTGDAILESIRRGSFYASTGVTIDSVGRNGDRVWVDSPDAMEVIAICDGGRRLFKNRGNRAEFDFAGPANPPKYVRFELRDANEGRAWTQPFFR